MPDRDPIGTRSLLRCPGCGEEVSRDDEHCQRCGRSLRAGRESLRRAAAGFEAGPRRYGGEFLGDAADLFGLYIGTSILTVLTLGLYAPWARVRFLRFFHEGTVFGGSRFRFTGTGSEVFRGFVVAGVVGIVLYVGYLLLVEAVGGSESLLWLPVTVAWLGLGTWFGHFAYFSSRRYRFARSTLREIRFRLAGSAKDFANRASLRLLAGVLSLGIFYADYIHDVWCQVYNRLHYGTVRFGYDGDLGEFRGLWLKGWILTLLTLGIYFFWWQPQVYNYFVAHLHVGGSRFRSRVTPGDYFGLTAGNALIVLLSLGLAWPWAACRSARFYLGRLHLEGDFDLDAAEQAMRAETTGFGEGMAEAMDMDVDLGF